MSIRLSKYYIYCLDTIMKLKKNAKIHDMAWEGSYIYQV